MRGVLRVANGLQPGARNINRTDLVETIGENVMSTPVLPAGISLQDLEAAIALIRGTAPAPAAPAPAPAPVAMELPPHAAMVTEALAKLTAKPKKTRKQTAPAPVAPAPVALTGTAPNGMRLDASDPYRAMVAFTHKAIGVLRNAEGNKSKGIHSVYSGFNAAFGQHFGLSKETVFSTVDLMTQRGDIASHFCRGGKMLYLPADAPKSGRVDTSAVLAKILG